MIDLHGLFVPLATPFTDDGAALGEVRLARLVRHLVGRGVEGLVIATETGEVATLSVAERKAALEITLRESQGAVPLIVNVTANGTAAAADLAQHAQRHGARGVVVAPPPWLFLTPAELEGHFRTIGSLAGLPMVILDAEGRLGREARERLAHRGRIAFGVGGAEPLRAEAFEAESLRVSPAAIAPSERVAEWMDQVREHGSAKCVKAFYEAQGIEVGRPRSPLVALEGESFRRIEALLDAS